MLVTAALVIGGVVVVSHRHQTPDAGPATVDLGARAIDPSYFANGACEEFAPTAGNVHHVVFLDAGHGGIDPGGQGITQSGATIYEAPINLHIVLDALPLLRAQGFTVVVSRTLDTTVLRLGPGDTVNGGFSITGEHDDVAARDVCANRAGANILVGVYMDVGSAESNAGSLTAYDAVRPFWRKSLRLANLVQHDVMTAMNAKGWQIPDDGVSTDDELGGPPVASDAAGYNHLLLLGPAESGYFDTPSQMPGALIEPLFLTDPFEGSIADSSKGQHAIAEGLAKAIAAYFTPIKHNDATSTVPNQ